MLTTTGAICESRSRNFHSTAPSDRAVTVAGLKDVSVDQYKGRLSILLPNLIHLTQDSRKMLMGGVEVSHAQQR
jgi:hypothetical protein